MALPPRATTANADQARHDPGEADAESARHLFAQSCTFIAGAAEYHQMPALDLPEVAFAGRSNVGKSSLINALTGRKTLARISRTPGRTQQINFFSLGERLMLVDLPGYGYARASKSRIRDWTNLVEAYLCDRINLRRLCLLIDARHGLTASDRDMVAMLDEAAVSYQLVLTKADKAKPSPPAQVRDLCREFAGHGAAHPDIVVTSARTGTGIDELRMALAALATVPQLG